MIYSKNKVTIRPLERKDLTGNYLKWMDDPIVTKYNSHGLFPQSEKELEEFMDSLDSKDKIVWAIIFNNIYHVGNVSIQSINWINKSAELAIVIGEHNYHGKGVGLIACQLTINHAFQKLNIHRIYSGTAAPNIGMQNVALKLGMIKEGAFRDATFINGEYCDIFLYSILKNEWRKNNVAMSKM